MSLCSYRPRVFFFSKSVSEKEKLTSSEGECDRTVEYHGAGTAEDSIPTEECRTTSQIEETKGIRSEESRPSSVEDYLRSKLILFFESTLGNQIIKFQFSLFLKWIFC